MPKYHKMLTDYKAPYIQSLMRLIETQSKATLANWSIDYVEKHILIIYEKTCNADTRLRDACLAARSWLKGEIKLPQAKQFILKAHEAAREAEGSPAAQAAARAAGQCAASIHSATHCIGLAFYGALAIAYDSLGIDAPWERLVERAAEECSKMEAALKAVAVIGEPNPAKINWSC